MVLNKDPTVRIYGARPHPRHVSMYVNSKSLNCMSTICDLAIKLFSDGNCQTVLYGESNSYKPFLAMFSHPMLVAMGGIKPSTLG
jgi:hypothetical protein